jgi:TPP-dependent 2-oxoacid decarboxylase
MLGALQNEMVPHAVCRMLVPLAGDFNLVLLDQLIKEERLRFVGCCNELNAGYAGQQ